VLSGQSEWATAPTYPSVHIPCRMLCMHAFHMQVACMPALFSLLIPSTAMA
jgi:hypothetical protein